MNKKVIRRIILLVIISFILWFQYTKPKYEQGSVWSYDTRPNETDSVVEIMNVWKTKDDEIGYTIRINGSKIDSEYLKSWFPGTATYYHVSEKALKRSLISKDKNRVIDAITWEEYRLWEKEYQGLKGVDHSSIKVMQQNMEDLFNVKLH